MQIIHDFFAAHQIKETSFAVGVSGGADSLALVLMLKHEFPEYRIIALTVDHQLRPSSHQEALYVSQLMEQYQIEHHILVWEGEKPQTGIEEQARLARYKLLCDWCLKNNINNLLIAHHLYDQAETFLMRLQRGSGLYGLAAMSEISERNGIRILRPLLNIHPNTLKDFLNKHCIKWIEDESNQCEDFLRVKMRKFLPLLEDITGISAMRLSEAAADLRKVKNFMEEMVDVLISEKVHKWENCGFSFDYTEFLSWHKELRFYVVGKLLTILGEKDYSPEAESLNLLIDQLLQNDFSSATLGNCYIQKSDLRIWIIKENRNIVRTYTTEAWDKYASLNPEVRGLKIPLKLKQGLLLEKLSKKI